MHYGREGYLAAMEQWLLPFEDYRHEMVPVFVRRAVREAAGVAA